MPLHITRDLQGYQTEVVLQQYGDRTMVLVTQMGKVGSLTQATIPATTELPSFSPSSLDISSSLPEPPVSIVLTPLLGASPNEHHRTLVDIYVSQIATLAWCSGLPAHIPVIVGIALKKRPQQAEEANLSDEDREVFKNIMSIVAEGLSGFSH